MGVEKWVVENNRVNLKREKNEDKNQGSLPRIEIPQTLNSPRGSTLIFLKG